MDILISSNLERLIYRISGDDPERTAQLMRQLAEDGSYEITEEMRERLSDFYGGYAEEQETFDKIRSLYEDTGYVIDTHTAVAAAVYDRYQEETGDRTPAVIASTASPFKFARSVMTAIDPGYGEVTWDDFALVDELSRIANVKVPAAVEELRTAPVLHTAECEKGEMEAMVKRFLKI